MPAKLQTEYMRNFKWTDRPIRFKQPVASLDSKPFGLPKRAGLASSMTGIHREPAVQAKQHVASSSTINIQPSAAEPVHHRSSRSADHRYRHHSSRQGASSSVAPFADPLYRPVPQVINSARSDDAPPAGKPTWKRAGDPSSAIADDFILLGSQQKFAPNVAYRLRKPLDPARLTGLPPKPAAERITDNDTQTADPVAIPSPPVARFYTADENVQVNEVELPNDALTPPPSPPDAPRREKSPSPVRVTEAVQTEVDDEYAVRHRLGMAARAVGPRYQTEYSRQFNQAHAVSAPAFRRMRQAESPVMNAEVMFRRSRSRSPVASAAMPPALLQTEYARSFRPYEWQLHQQPGAKRRALSAEGHEILYDAKVPVAVEAPPVSVEQRHRHRHHRPESQEQAEQPLKIKQGKWPKRYVSEYASNFRQPSAFHYEDGTWKGVAQPHVAATQSVPANAVVVGDPSWLSEVRELKSRAKEYQLRNKGTHFSSAHVAQLFSEKAGLWDQPDRAQNGDGGSRLAMLDVSAPRSQVSPSAVQEQALISDYVQVDTLPTPEDLIRPAGLPTVRRGTVRDSLEWAIASVSSLESCSESECSSTVPDQAPTQREVLLQPSPPVAVETQTGPNVYKLEISKTARSDDSATSSSDSQVLPSAAGGRVRTSRMAELQHRGNGSPRRHHLDITTPAVGGALLVSPPMPSTKKTEEHFRKNRSGSRNRGIAMDESARTLPLSGVSRAESSGYSSGGAALGTSGRARSPASSGKPTSDTHIIVERDKPIRFQYVAVPKQQKPTKSNEIRPAGIPAAGTVEQLILERSRENVPVMNIGSGKVADKKSIKKAPLSVTQQISSAGRNETKPSQRSGLMIAIPESMSTTYKVAGGKPQKKATIAQHLEDHRNRSPPSRASSATVSVASDILEKARSRSNFWDKNSSNTVRIN